MLNYLNFILNGLNSQRHFSVFFESLSLKKQIVENGLEEISLEGLDKNQGQHSKSNLKVTRKTRSLDIKLNMTEAAGGLV
jgi:hypothetical protein